MRVPSHQARSASPSSPDPAVMRCERDWPGPLSEPPTMIRHQAVHAAIGKQPVRRNRRTRLRRIVADAGQHRPASDASGKPAAASSATPTPRAWRSSADVLPYPAAIRSSPSARWRGLMHRRDEAVPAAAFSSFRIAGRANRHPCGCRAGAGRLQSTGAERDRRKWLRPPSLSPTCKRSGPLHAMRGRQHDVLRQHHAAATPFGLATTTV